MAAISTAPLYTAQHPGWNYEAMPYASHELPAPLPQRSDKLPWERKEAMEKERQEHNITETQKAYDEAARQKARGGFFNSMAASIKPRWARIKTTPRPVREAIPSKRDERKFNNKFHFPAYERLLYASELCKTVSGTQQILGKIYISENFLCFRESRLQPKGGRRQRLLLVIPIEEILSLAQAEISSHPDPRYAPEFRVLDQWHSKGDGIFLFTRDEKVHRFFGFWTQQTFHDTFNVLDRQWRSRNVSDAPLRRGESAANRNSLPVSAARSPSYVMSEPAAVSYRSSTGPDRSARMSSGKQSQSQTQNRRIPHALSMDLKHSPITRLRHVAEPSPRFNHVLVDSGSSVELIELDSAGAGVSGGRRSSQGQQQFGLAQQSRDVRSSQYKPQQRRSEQTAGREIREDRDWQSRQGYQGYQTAQGDERRWTKKEQGGRRISSDLANEIKQVDVSHLHHVEQIDYVPSGVKFGRVADSSRRASWAGSQQQDRIGYVQSDRVGFQTVQKRIQSQQRGRMIDSQLKDEIGHFNLRALNHVQPTVRQWMPTAADIKMRVPSGYGERAQEAEHKKRHRHHHHHKHPRQGDQTSEQSDELGPIQHIEVFEYEIYDIEPSKGFVREQTNKLEEQLKMQDRQRVPMQQQGLAPDRWASNGFEAGTA